MVAFIAKCYLTNGRMIQVQMNPAFNFLFKCGFLMFWRRHAYIEFDASRVEKSGLI